VVFLALGFILPILTFGEDNVEALFTKGNILYSKAQYKDALKAYQQILDEGYQSAAVYFNMGNASYKSDDISSALLYYEKAHKLAPGDDDINSNIRFANLKTTDKIDEAPEFFLVNWWRVFILSLSISALSMLSILLFLFGSGVLIVYFFTNSVSIKKASFYSAVILFFLGIIAIFTCNRQISYFDNHHQAIIFSSAITIKSAPGDKAASLFVLHEGTKVNILDNSSGWMKIRLANGNEGWIKNVDVRKI